MTLPEHRTDVAPVLRGYPPLTGPAWSAEQDPAGEFAPADLLSDLTTLSARLGVEIERRRWLDAYLLAAGAAQVLDDHLRRRGATLRRGARFLRTTGAPGTATLATACRTAAAAFDRVTAQLPSARALEDHRRAVARLVDVLAPLVLSRDESSSPRVPREVGRAAAVWRRTLSATSSGVGNQILRLPACFRSMDQHPEDMRSLGEAFAARWPDRARPLAVVGVRTSGSYLAPLVGATLDGLGYRSVVRLTIRPGEPLTRGESVAVRAVTRTAGLVLVVDDPPVTGASIATVAQQLERGGIPAASVVLLLARAEDEPAPLPALARYAQVALHGPDWHIRRVLQGEALRDALREALPPTIELVRLERHPHCAETPNPGRGHVEAPCTAELHDHTTGRTVYRDLVVEGVGLGYLGRHALAIARALPGWVPTVFGFADGVLLREATCALRQPEPGLARLEDTERLAEHVVDYVVARHRALPTTADTSTRVPGHYPAWELAAEQLCAVLGRLGPPLRIPLVDPILRRLLAVASPMIVDGRMYPERWRRPYDETAADEAGGRIVKETFAEGAFSNRESFSYDPVFDLAGAAVHTDCAWFTERLRRGYVAHTATRIAEERWLIHQLLHLRAATESGRLSVDASNRRRSRAIQRFFAAIHLADVTPDTAGPFCALDIDGVLEISPLGCAMTSRAGALALRALLVHGYQPLLATGRDLEDVQDRCANYGLRGGVAEYGALVYEHDTGTVVELVDGAGRNDLARVREVLVQVPGIWLDPGHHLTVRACHGSPGNRRGLCPAEAEAALVAAGVVGRIRAIPGDAQTDFVPVGVDKSTGLRRLLELLRVTAAGESLALAVGDAMADAGMLAMADVAWAPRNADAALSHRGVRRTRAQYQVGLAQAVGSFLGHPPGRCARCRPPASSADARALETLLSVTEGGRPGVPARLVRLALHTARARWGR